MTTNERHSLMVSKLGLRTVNSFSSIYIDISQCHKSLSGTDCFHCGSFSLASLRSRIAFFSESDSVPRTLPFFSSQGPVRKKQRTLAAGDKRAHAGSMPTCLAITAERALACPLHPTRSASLRGCERHGLVRCERQQTGWQPFPGGFRRGRVIGLCDWPLPLADICLKQHQTQSRWRVHPRYDKGCQRARARMVSAWGAISQQAGRVVSSRAPSGFPPMLLSWSARWVHKIMMRPLLVSHLPLFFKCSKIRWWRCR